MSGAGLEFTENTGAEWLHGDDQQIQDGGIIVSFPKPKVLDIRAQRYDSGGADSERMLAEITKVTRSASVSSFVAVVRLRGIWWSKVRRESSEHCITVLRGLFQLGCRGFKDILELPGNDLDDTFVDEFLELLAGHIGHDCSLEYINLKYNRITTHGALRLIWALQERGARPNLSLKENPIDDCEQVKQAAEDAGVECDVDTPWTLENGMAALNSKDDWSTYFAGPAQFLRAKILERSDMPLAECPICSCILTHDPRRAHKTVHNRLNSHLRGNPHRKKLQHLAAKFENLPLILIVSPTWSFTVHPLTGELRVFEKSLGAVVGPLEPELNVYDHVDTQPDAPDPKGIQAVMSAEGRASLAMELEPDLAYEILKECAEDCKNGEHEESEASIWPPAETKMELWVQDVDYTQKGISSTFGDGRCLDVLIEDLNSGNVHPRADKRMELEVVKFRDKFYSNNNRRLYCLKKHQQRWEECGWQVWVAARVFDFDGSTQAGVYDRL